MNVLSLLVNEEDRKIYGNVGQIAGRLSAIMRTLLVKRLESSFFAFKQSLKRLNKAIDNMIKMFDEDRVFIAPDLDINKLLEEGLSFDEIESKINSKGGNNREFEKAAFDKTFYSKLLEDKEKIEELVKRWKKVKTDPKLIAFLDKVRNEFFIKKNNLSGKLVIFTESKETAEELTEKLESEGKHKILYISAKNRKHKETVIAENFDANIEEEKWKDDYNIIITTEVLAEGVNLHRSNIIINYDVPWNSTRNFCLKRIAKINK